MSTVKREIRFGDAAVEGLLNGILGGVAMAAWVLVVEWMRGIPPQTALGYFDASHGGSPLAGALMHLAVAGVYGIVFGAMAALAARAGFVQARWWWGTLLGLLYGLILSGIAQGIILPETNAALLALPAWAWIGAHLLYGAVLGTLQLRPRK